MPYVRLNITHDFPKRKPANASEAFCEQYIALRHKEDRLYSDDQVRQLPSINNNHPHHSEWLARKRSSGKLAQLLAKMKRPLNILEVGCGNGWLSNKLSHIPGSRVTGFDINTVELQQAQRVFGHRLNLDFVSTDPLTGTEVFDVIVFAASIQYFSSVEVIIGKALKHLADNGSIHIIDSRFYKPEDVHAARKRSQAYYDLLGFPELCEHYFHHSIQSFEPFNFQVIYDPNATWNKLLHRHDPFHWICIQKSVSPC